MTQIADISLIFYKSLSAPFMEMTKGPEIHRNPGPFVRFRFLEAPRTESIYLSCVLRRQIVEATIAQQPMTEITMANMVNTPMP